MLPVQSAPSTQPGHRPAPNRLQPFCARCGSSRCRDAAAHLAKG